MANTQELQMDLNRLEQTGFDEMLTHHATANGFAPSLFFAIASRETDCVNRLGDVQSDGPHGVGIVQIDIQHDLARQARDSGSWKRNPEPLVAFGAQLLAANIREAQQTFPALRPDQQLKIAASGYNCGMGKAIAAERSGDSDLYTTGHNYGADVMARKWIFDQLTAKQAAAAVAGS